MVQVSSGKLQLKELFSETQQKGKASEFVKDNWY